MVEFGKEGNYKMVELKILQQRLRASSIFEVTVAMVLILAIFSTAIIIYLNITSASPQLRKFKYEAYLTSAAQEAIHDKSLVNASWKDESVTIYKNAQPYQGNTKLILLNLKAEDAIGKVIAEYNILVYAPE